MQSCRILGIKKRSHSKTCKIYAKLKRRRDSSRSRIPACWRDLEDFNNYVWIDTCCIDKTSSAEFTEAINSMYRWYQKADICYAHLEDFVCQEVFDGYPEVEKAGNADRQSLVDELKIQQNT
jgi:hypothetical protein